MVRGRVKDALRAGHAIALAALAFGCAAIQNDPVNAPLSAAPPPIRAEHSADDPSDDMVVALALSGGGMRAAAFSYGVLTGFDETRVRSAGKTMSLLDHLDFVSGVSGGAVLAAYYGLRRRAAMADFKQRFLLANPQQDLQMDLGLANIARGLQGGVNDSTQFPRWLDDHLFNHATFGQLLTGQRPAVWINASDIYDRTAFLFSPVTFDSLCSDLRSYPISLAVAASAAVPVLFAPIVIKNYPGGCPTPLPAWVDRVRNEKDARPLIRSYADALERYRSGAIKYVKLLDGGLVDNYGLAAVTITRLANSTPYGPLSPHDAVRLRRLLFLVVDSGREPAGRWAQTVAGPTGVDLINAASDTATGAGALGSYATFSDTMDSWRDALVRWRCRLSEAERHRYGAPPGWNCRNVKFFIGRIAFDQLGHDRAVALNAVETSLHLPPAQIDMLIAAGRDALQSNTVFRGFLDSLPAPARAPRPPAATPVSGRSNAHEALAQ
jgi:NTE family protein